ncbi:MAG: MarR family winged helix-turn-helix transcriptional regulator [Kofleriaceae bacterium]
MQTPLKLSFHGRFGYRLVVIARRWRAQVDAELEAFGLSQATWRPLLHLATLKDGPRQRDLAESLQIGCPALVRLLDNLEEKGLVERTDVDGDRRVKQVKLTPEGRQLASRVYEIMVEVERRLLQDLTPDDLAGCSDAFASIERRLDRYEAEQPT